MALKTVEMKYSETGTVIKPKTNLIDTLYDSVGATGLCPGCWIASQIALVTGGDVADYVVDTIYDYQGRPLNFQYVTTTQLDAQASGTDYKLRVYPIGKIVFEMLEDATGGAIAASYESGAGFADVTIAEPTGFERSDIVPVGGGAIATQYVDSNTIAASESALLMEIVGLSPREARVYGASTKRRWYVKVTTANATYSQ